jgi:chemotaxis response regulator CheB
MPGSVVEVGAAEEVLPLGELALALTRRVNAGASGALPSATLGQAR